MTWGKSIVWTRPALSTPRFHLSLKFVKRIAGGSWKTVVLGLGLGFAVVAALPSSTASVTLNWITTQAAEHSVLMESVEFSESDPEPDSDPADVDEPGWDSGQTQLFKASDGCFIHHLLFHNDNRGWRTKTCLGGRTRVGRTNRALFLYIGFQNKHLKILARLQTFLQNNRRNLPWERRQSQNPYDLLDQSSLASTHIRVSYDQHFIQVYKQQQQKEQKKRKKNSKDYVADLFFFRYSSEREKW